LKLSHPGRVSPVAKTEVAKTDDFEIENAGPQALYYQG
jgi:hypothetical protein